VRAFAPTAQAALSAGPTPMQSGAIARDAFALYPKLPGVNGPEPTVGACRARLG